MCRPFPHKHPCVRKDRQEERRTMETQHFFFQCVICRIILQEINCQFDVKELMSQKLISNSIGHQMVKLILILLFLF